MAFFGSPNGAICGIPGLKIQEFVCRCVKYFTIIHSAVIEKII